MSQRHPFKASTGTAITISGIRIPDSKLAREIAELVRDSFTIPAVSSTGAR